jgi:hypothetical protein
MAPSEAPFMKLTVLPSNEYSSKTIIGVTLTDNKKQITKNNDPAILTHHTITTKHQRPVVAVQEKKEGRSLIGEG